MVFGGRETLVRSYPISIDWPNAVAAGVAPADECRRSVLGVDRLDYTKGIEERLLAVERFLERFPHLRGRFTFLQLAAPSRTTIERYGELGESAALATALAMPAQEQSERMRAMRSFVGEFNVYRWAGRMLTDAARVRQTGRLSARLSMGGSPRGGGARMKPILSVDGNALLRDLAARDALLAFDFDGTLPHRGARAGRRRVRTRPGSRCSPRSSSPWGPGGRRPRGARV